MAWGGGSIDNKTSRLYRALVDTELAVGVDGGMTPTIDPFVYSINIVVRDGVEHQQVEDAFNAEIAKLIEDGISERELARAKKQARALFAYGTERVTMQAFWLAFAENFTSYAWFENYVANLEAVTAEDVKAVAQRYLRPQNRTVGWFVPVMSEDMGDLADDEEIEA